MFRFWLLVVCWSRCVLTERLGVDQHLALMDVYTSLGSFACWHVVSQFTFFFLFVLQRMQQLDVVPAIRYVVRLCWHWVDLR